MAIVQCSACGAENRPGRVREQAASVFERLGAQPWLERAQALGEAVPA